MKELALKTPTKDVKKAERLEFDLFDDAPCEDSPDTVESEVDPEVTELEELRKLFVGDVDITEGLCSILPPS